MEGLLELKSYIQQGNYTAALNLLGEMEEVSREASITNSVYRIHYTHYRGAEKGYHFQLG